jgi:hypothetical protein
MPRHRYQPPKRQLLAYIAGLTPRVLINSPSSFDPNAGKMTVEPPPQTPYPFAYPVFGGSPQRLKTDDFANSIAEFFDSSFNARITVCVWRHLATAINNEFLKSKNKLSKE